ASRRERPSPRPAPTLVTRRKAPKRRWRRSLGDGSGGWIAGTRAVLRNAVCCIAAAWPDSRRVAFTLFFRLGRVLFKAKRSINPDSRNTLGCSPAFFPADPAAEGRT